MADEEGSELRERREQLRRFVLLRSEDVSGVSGLGVVAEGVEFSDGVVCLRWCTGEHRSSVLWDEGVAGVEAVHGHGGRTRVVFLD